jgi:hypothetical protein
LTRPMDRWRRAQVAAGETFVCGFTACAVGVAVWSMFYWLDGWAWHHALTPAWLWWLALRLYFYAMLAIMALGVSVHLAIGFWRRGDDGQ